MKTSRFGLQFLKFDFSSVKLTRSDFFSLGALTLLAYVVLGNSMASAQSSYEPFTFSTFAGLAGSPGSADGNGANARFFLPIGITIDSGGNVFVADSENFTIRKISPTGDVTTFAGQAGSQGSSDGFGSAARFSFPAGLAVDLSDNIYVADFGNHTIRKITPNGDVSTLAGLAGNPGSVDGQGNAARFNGPAGVAVDDVGNVYVADSFNNTIRVITSAGDVSTLAGLAGQAGSTDGAGSVARFDLPQGVAVDLKQNVFVADYNNNSIRRVTPPNLVSTLAGLAGSKGSADGTGNAARFNNPFAVAVDRGSNLYVADSRNHTMRKLSPDGAVTTLAGLADVAGSADGSGSAARFNLPEGIAVDNFGTLFVADTLNDTIRSGVLAPPSIISPLSFTATLGQPFVYQFEAIGADDLSVSGLPAGLIFDSSIFAITGGPTTAGTTQVTLTASNASGVTSATLVLTIQPAPSSGPVIISSTTAKGRTGVPFSFQVITTGATAAARLTATGLPPGLGVDPVSGVISCSPTVDGSSGVTLSVTEAGLTTIGTLELTFTSDPNIPVIISPESAFLLADQSFNYTVIAPNNADPATDPTLFALLGPLPPGLGFDPVAGVISGTFTPGAGSRPSPDLSGGIVTNVQLFASNSHGTGTIPLVFFTAPSGVVNISTRLAVLTGDDVLIGGFIITGNAPKRVLLRGIGPSLPVTGMLADTTLELHDGTGMLLGSNDDWRDTQEQEIIGTTIPPINDLESAIQATLEPGAYTAILSGKNNTTGVGLVEVYDLGTASLDVSSQAQLVNISTRGKVQTSDNVMIGGFIVSGSTPVNVLLRAIGPELTDKGVAGALQDTTLELHDSNGALLASNDDWQSDQEQEIIDTTIPPADPRESAIVSTLAAGAYTAIVQGKDTTTGVGLVEVYVLP